MKVTGWKSQVEIGLLSCHRISRVLNRMLEGKVSEICFQSIKVQPGKKDGHSLCKGTDAGWLSRWITTAANLPFIAHREVDLIPQNKKGL